jgi:DNA replication protein DnaC
MLSEPTLEKLREMRLTAMAEALEEQRKDPKIHELDFDERFGLLVDAEHLARKNRKLSNLLRKSQLRISDACVEDLECSSERGLTRSLAHQLGSCRWIDERANVLIEGKTGVGKTYLACALAQQACRRGYRTLYRRLPRLYDEVALSRADGSWPKLLRLLSRTEVLVLDDFGLTPLSSTKRHDLLEIFEEREGRSSTIVTSQLPQKTWHEYLGEPTVADAILDRVVHNSYKVKLKGPSKRKGKKENEER